MGLVLVEDPIWVLHPLMNYDVQPYICEMKTSQNINKQYIKSHIKLYYTKHLNFNKNMKFIHKVIDWSYVYFFIVIFSNCMYIINQKDFINIYRSSKWMSDKNIKITRILFIMINLFFSMKSDKPMFRRRIFNIENLRCLLCYDKWLVSITYLLKINQSHSSFIHFDTTLIVNPLIFEKWNSKHGIINPPYLLY